MERYAVINIWTKHFKTTMKKLQIIAETDSIFDDKQLKFIICSPLGSVRREYITLLADIFPNECIEHVAISISQNIEPIVISFYGDNKSINFSLYQSGEVLTQYKHDPGGGCGFSDIAKIHELLYPPKPSSPEASPALKKYRAEGLKYLWEKEIGVYPPKTLKEHLTQHLGIAAEKPVDFYRYARDKEMSWKGADIYRMVSDHIPEEITEFTQKINYVINNGKPSDTIVLLGEYKNGFGTPTFENQDYISLYIAQQNPRKLEKNVEESNHEEFYKPDKNGKYIPCGKNDYLVDYEIIRPDYNYLHELSKKYYLMVYDKIEFDLIGADKENNVYMGRGNKIYVIAPSFECSRIETIKGRAATWCLNSYGEICIEAISVFHGLINTTRIYKIPIPEWDAI